MRIIEGQSCVYLLLSKKKNPNYGHNNWTHTRNTSSNHHITFEEYEYDDGELGLEESEIEEIDTLIYEEAKGSSSAGEKPGAMYFICGIFSKSCITDAERRACKRKKILV